MKRRNLFRGTINALLFAAGIYIAICAFNDIRTRHDANFNQCMQQQDYSPQWECHCAQKWYMTRHASRFTK